MVTFYFMCILLLIHHESTYCESPSTTTKSSDTRTTAATTATSDTRTTAATTATPDTRTTAATTATSDTRTTAATTATSDTRTMATTTATSDARTTVDTAATSDTRTTVDTAATSDTRTTAATTATPDTRTTAATTATSDTRTTAATTATIDTRTIEYSLSLAYGKFGRVQIKMRNTWNYVCSNNFSDADATVVCRELGYKGGFAYLLPYPYQFGRNRIVSSLGCTGTEKTIRDCSDFTDAFNCDTDIPAAAYCYHNSGFDFRLANVSTSGYGHIEMAVDGEWRPFCGWRNFDNNQRALYLACQQMGFSNGTASPRIKKNPVKNIWVPHFIGCSKGATQLMSCKLVLNGEELAYDHVNLRNTRHHNEYFMCYEGYLPLIKCF